MSDEPNLQEPTLLSSLTVSSYTLRNPHGIPDLKLDVCSVIEFYSLRKERGCHQHYR